MVTKEKAKEIKELVKEALKNIIEKKYGLNEVDET